MQHVRVQPVHGTLELPAIQFPLAELATREQKRKVGSEAYFRIVEILIAIWEPATNGPDGRKNDRTCLRNVHVAFWEIMLPFLVLFRGLKKLEPRPFQYSLGVKTKIPDEHPRPFHMGVWESPPILFGMKLGWSATRNFSLLPPASSWTARSPFLFS